MNQGLEEGQSVARGAQIDSEAVTAALECVQASPSFKASDRIRRFLSYVVEETLEGRANRIKAFSIATDVFGRDASFDPNTDPIVRIEAGRLRRALERYYLKDGANDPLIIDIPKGSYVPVFLTGDSLGGKERASGAPVAIEASVATQTFRDLSENSDHAYLAAGISEEICVALAQYPEMRVVPTVEDQREVSAQYIGRRLGVQFVIGGSVKREGNRVRITARLAETVDGSQVWVKSFDRDLTAASLFEIQDDIAHKVVVSIAEAYGGAISESLQKRVRSIPNLEFSAYEAILRLYHYNQVESMSTWAQTRDALGQAVQSSPDFALALAGLAELTADGIAYNYLPHSVSEIEKALELARRAMVLEPTHCQPHHAAALLNIALRKPDGVVSEAEAILAKLPSVGDKTFAGFHLAVAGDFDRGIPIVEAGIRELPTSPPWLHHALFLNHFRCERYEDALVEAYRFDMPTIIWSFVDKAVALAALGRREEADAEIEKVIALHEDFAEQPRRYVEWYVLDDEVAASMSATLSL